MNNLKNFYDLDFYENPLVENFDINTIFDDKDSIGTGYFFKRVDNYEIKKVINHEIIAWAESKQIPVLEVYIFVNLGTTTPHTDKGSEEKTALTINWCIQNPEADMIWYKCKSNANIQSNKFYVGYNLDDLEVIEKHKVIGPTLVNVHTPHAIQLHNLDEPRICVSIRFYNRFSSWDKIVEFFKPFLK